jgi:hypothetical protein
MGAYKSGTTWAQDDSCGAETGVRGILFSTPTSGAQVCIETLKYSGFNIDHDWFECGVGIQSEGTFGNISNNTFDGSTWLGINLIDYGNNNYSTGTHTLIVAQQPILFSEAIRTSDNWN